jgi:hypothetical protein
VFVDRNPYALLLSEKFETPSLPQSDLFTFFFWRGGRTKMLTPDNVWNGIIHKLDRNSRMTLRQVNWEFLVQVDERFRTYRDLKRIIDQCSTPRHLLRTLYVPQGFRRPLPPPRHVTVQRPPYPDPSEWNVSVMTVVSYLSTPLDPRSVFHCVDVVDFSELTGEQTRDLMVAKEEAQCDQVMSPTGGVSIRCLRKECGCLAAFFPGILDIHFKVYCRGNPQFAEVKAKKRGRPTARSFENQCTMRICMSRTVEGSEQKNGQLWNIVNLKMFQNGKIQMTGCKSIDQARGTVQFLLRKLMEKAPAMRSKRDCMTQLRCFALGTDSVDDDEDGPGGGGSRTGRKILDSIHRASQSVSIQEHSESERMKLLLGNREIWEQILLRVDNESLFACRRVSHFINDVVHSDEFWRKKCERELRCECDEDSGGWHMTYKYNGRFQRMERVRRPEHFSHPRLLYTRYRSLRRHRPFLVVEQFEELSIAGEQVAMINSDFRTNFELNLAKLFKILYRSYGRRTGYNNQTIDNAVDRNRWNIDVDGIRQALEFDGGGKGGGDGDAGRIIHAHYSPDDYVAVNVKYLSPIPPDPVPMALESEELCDDKRTVISFFIFRTGSVIINSARNEAQLRDAYYFINSIFRRHYVEIWNPPSRRPSSNGRRRRSRCNRRRSAARRRSVKKRRSS